jgi:hypothetical protein
MTQSTTEKPAGGISGALSDEKNEWVATSANAERDAERPPHLFKPGQSGNPAGKKPGTRNRATRALEELLEGQGEALTQKAIDLALAGDTVALKLCLERIYPARNDRAVRFALPPITSPRDAAEIAAAVAQAVAAGRVTPREAAEIGKVIEIYIKAYQTAELNDRVACVKQMSDEELMRVITSGSGENVTPRLITIGPG